MKPQHILVSFWLAGGAAMAQPMGTQDFGRWVQQERDRIAAEREVLERRWFEDERACYQRFAVNDCLRQARRQHRAALADLRRQEVLISDEERQRQAQERLRRLEQGGGAEAGGSPPRTAP